MNRLANQIISYLLLLCFLATIFPLNLLHHHNKLINDAPENASYHISICHINNFQSSYCGHKSHYNKGYIECAFCKFISSYRNNYILNKFYIILYDLSSLTLPIIKLFFSPCLSSNIIFNRGPPLYNFFHR